MDELTSRSATELAWQIRSGEVSSREVVDAHLARIAAVNPAINAVVHLTADAARAEADAADAQLAKGGALGPLHGVPATIKDCYDTAGVVTTGGTLGRKDHVPDTNAPTVQRLKDAGAIVLGKTNCPEFCLAFETDNLVYGRTNNPYDTDRVAGGSSGGEGAIVAAGGSPLGLGSDGGGSIRVPAHCNGIAGLKPTTGRIPTTGIWPPFKGILEATNSAGPLARTVDDLILALPVLAGPDGQDPQAIDMPLRSPDAVPLDELRVAVHSDNGIAKPIPEIIRAVEAAARALSDAGAKLEDACPPHVAAAPDLFMGIYSVDQAAYFRDCLREAGTKDPHPMLASTLAAFSQQPMTGQDAARVLERWDDYRRAMWAWIQDYDAILCPANAYAPLPHGETFANIIGFAYTFAYNLTGWPGVVVRGGTAPGGLPVGVQIVARPWREDVALALARCVEAASGGWQAPQL
jgi:amidase